MEAYQKPKTVLIISKHVEKKTCQSNWLKTTRMVVDDDIMKEEYEQKIALQKLENRN